MLQLFANTCERGDTHRLMGARLARHEALAFFGREWTEKRWSNKIDRVRVVPVAAPERWKDLQQK